MTTTKTMTLAATLLALAASATLAGAQDNGDPAPGGPPNGDGNGFRPQRPPLPAVVRALDANHDGIVDSNEIANASTALKTLDKNGDGKLTMPELMGPRPQMRGEGMRGQRRGQGGPEGDGQRPHMGPPPGDDGGTPPPSDAPPADQ